jgi:membrane-bound lytic murein transglycosylase D
MSWSKGKILLLITLLVFIIVVFALSSYKLEYANRFKEKYSIFSISVPDKLDFAGEQVPLNYFDVKESLDRELHVNTYWQSQTIFLIKRANRYFPEIEPILKDEGVPLDFKYLVVAESGLTNTVSPLSATGFWQFLKKTGKEYGLEISEEVDERYNLEKSTRAACKFLKESYVKYGSWTLAAASYNMGRQAISRTIEIQEDTNYYNLFLNEETARYIYRILAIKLLIENPELYGFYIDKKDLYPPFKYTELKVDSSIPDLAVFAKKNKTNYKVLKIFNPWLRDSALTVKKKTSYIIKIPAEGFRESAYVENHLPSDSTLKLTP